jgi:hypothetical protein
VPDFFAQARKANRAHKMVVVESGPFAGQPPDGDFDFGVAAPVFEPDLQPPQPPQSMPVREPFQSLPHGFPLSPFGESGQDGDGQGVQVPLGAAQFAPLEPAPVAAGGSAPLGAAPEEAGPLQDNPSWDDLIAGNPTPA